MMGHGGLWSGVNPDHQQPGQPMMGVACPNAGAGGHGPNPFAANPIYAIGSECRGGTCNGCGVPLACPCCTASHFLADDELEVLESDDDRDWDAEMDFENHDEAELVYNE